MLILGIETSCDETAAAVVKNGQYILSNEIASSLKHHKRFGGVIPEIATRHHAENIDKVIQSSLKKSRFSIEDMDAVAVTQGPGLVGALLCGISCAKAISYAMGIPLIAVDHVKAHMYAAIMHLKKIRFPFIGLVVSGGHSRIYMVEDFDNYKIIGDTLDDAVGEAYDKVAKILGLGYPGGPIIDKLAKKGNSKAIKFTCNAIKDSLDFSFSGIKTAVLYYTRTPRQITGGQARHKDTRTHDIAASFQESVLNVITGNTLKAMERYNIKDLVVGGGVSANSRLREMFEKERNIRKINVYMPPMPLCADNGAMIAGLGYRLYKKRLTADLDMTAKI